MRFCHYGLLLAFSFATLAGCTSNLSPDVYATQNTGKIQRVVSGTVISSRAVRVADRSTNSNAGVLTGGALGALAGSTIGKGRGSLAAGIGGALLGGLAGKHAQTSLSSQTGIEYIIKLRNQRLISVVQGPTPLFFPGQSVFVQYGLGSRSRVVADPRNPG